MKRPSPFAANFLDWPVTAAKTILLGTAVGLTLDPDLYDAYINIPWRSTVLTTVGMVTNDFFMHTNAPIRRLWKKFVTDRTGEYVPIKSSISKPELFTGTVALLGANALPAMDAQVPLQEYVHLFQDAPLQKLIGHTLLSLVAFDFGKNYMRTHESTKSLAPSGSLKNRLRQFVTHFKLDSRKNLGSKKPVKEETDESLRPASIDALIDYYFNVDKDEEAFALLFNKKLDQHDYRIGGLPPMFRKYIYVLDKNNFMVDALAAAYQASVIFPKDKNFVALADYYYQEIQKDKKVPTVGKKGILGIYAYKRGFFEDARRHLISAEKLLHTTSTTHYASGTDEVLVSVDPIAKDFFAYKKRKQATLEEINKEFNDKVSALQCLHPIPKMNAPIPLYSTINETGGLIVSKLSPGTTLDKKTFTSTEEMETTYKTALEMFSRLALHALHSTSIPFSIPHQNLFAKVKDLNVKNKNAIEKVANWLQETKIFLPGVDSMPENVVVALNEMSAVDVFFKDQEPGAFIPTNLYIFSNQLSEEESKILYENVMLPFTTDNYRVDKKYADELLTKGILYRTYRTAHVWSTQQHREPLIAPQAERTLHFLENSSSVHTSTKKVHAPILEELILTH